MLQTKSFCLKQALKKNKEQQLSTYSKIKKKRHFYFTIKNKIFKRNLNK